MSVNAFWLTSGGSVESSIGLNPGTVLWPRAKKASLSREKRKPEKNRIAWGWEMGSQSR